MENGTGLSASDVALLDNNGFGGNGFMGIFGLLILLGILNGGFGGFGNNGNFDRWATQSDVQYTSQFGQLLDGNRDIMNQANNNSNNIVNAVNQSEYETIAAMKDAQLQLQDRLSGLSVGQADMLARFNDAIGNTRLEIAGASAGLNQNIMQNRYEGALNTDRITTAILLDGQKTRDMLQHDKIETLQGKLYESQLERAMCGVPRFTNNFTYPVPFMPFYPPIPPTTSTGGTTTTG